MVTYVFALKAMVEQEDDDMIIEWGPEVSTVIRKMIN